MIIYSDKISFYVSIIYNITLYLKRVWSFTMYYIILTFLVRFDFRGKNNNNRTWAFAKSLLLLYCLRRRRQRCRLPFILSKPKIQFRFAF